MHRIVVVSDLAMNRDGALERGCALAAANCADLHIVQLACRRERAPVLRGEDRAAVLADAHARFPGVALMTIDGPVPRNARTIAARAQELNADLIVMRNEIDPAQPDDRPFDLIVDVARRTSIPVLAAQGDPGKPYRRLLALLDKGADARRVLDLALQMKSAECLFAVHACPKDSSDQETASALAELELVIATALEGRCDVTATVTPIVRRGDLESVLIEGWSELQPDLIVAATHKRHGLGSIFGYSHVADLLEVMPFDLLVTNLEVTSAQDRIEPAKGDASPHARAGIKALSAARDILRHHRIRSRRSPYADRS